MNWHFMNGLYPYNNLWMIQPFLILLFEIGIILCEFWILEYILQKKEKGSSTDLLIAVTVANITTFALGFVLNWLVPR